MTRCTNPTANALETVHRGARSLREWIAKLAARSLREALRRHVRAQPRARVHRDARAQVTILLGSAWGMGGTIRATLSLAGYLAPRHDVEIISVMRRRETPFFPFPPRIKLTTLDDQRPGAAPLCRRFVRHALRGRSSVLMPPETRPFAACSVWTDVRLARALRRRSGVLIGTHPSLNLVAADLRPPRFITIAQEHMHLQAHRRSLRRTIARQYPRLDALVVLTDQDAREYTELGTPIAPLVIPNTVRRTGSKARLDGTTILAAGRLTPQKGFDLLIPAFARVAATHPEWRLRICGRGPQKRKLLRLVDEHGLADVVSLPGPAKHLEKEMENASLFVLSSRFEGFPLVLLEAMSVGLPIVSFDCPTGPRNVIEDHRNGILVPAGDVEALADAMLELVQDGRLRRRIGEEAKRTADEYTMEAIGPRWEGLFDELGRSGTR